MLDRVKIQEKLVEREPCPACEATEVSYCEKHITLTEEDEGVTWILIRFIYAVCWACRCKYEYAVAGDWPHYNRGSL